MENENTLSRVAKVMASLMDVDSEAVNRDSSPESIDEWDSMSHVQLIVALEKEFGISIGPDDAVEFESAGMICDWLESKVA